MAKLDSPIQPGHMAPYGKLPVPRLTRELMGLVHSGTVYSLAVLHYEGMQVPGPMVPYTLSARIRHGDLTEIAPASATAEIITMSAHTATHIDALCHVGEFQNADGELDPHGEVRIFAGEGKTVPTAPLSTYVGQQYLSSTRRKLLILDRFRLDGKVALVTGGSRGLGFGMAVALAEAGADIISIQHTSHTEALAERITSTGRCFLPLTLDIGTETAAKEALEVALASFGYVNILVNNAGVQRRAPAVDFPIEDWDTVINVNLRAVFLFCQVFGGQMLHQGHGKIINIASLQSVQGGITIPAYTASKHAIAGLTKSLCNEWASKGVNVNAIAPGYIDTDLNVALRANSERERQISERIPAGRWGTPEDMAGAVVFLASPASDYLHGHMLVVDGGWLAR